MLVELTIRNLAIIEHVHLSLEPGLTVLTGETGAGKSILVDAVELLLGARADATFIRQGADQAYIEGVFQLAGPTANLVRDRLAREELLDEDAPDTVVLARELRRRGRHLARINGRAVSLRLLREIAAALVDVHGQSEHLSLLRPGTHLALLDRFAHVDDLLQAYQQVYQRLRALERELDELRALERDAARKADLLRYQIQEIRMAGLQPGEDEALLAERNRLLNAERLANLTRQALLWLEEGAPEAMAALDALGQAVDALHDLAAIDPDQRALADDAQAHLEALADLARQLRDYADQLDFEPQQLDEIEARLALIDDLKRKYGATIEDVLAFAAQAEQELETIVTASDRIAELEAQREALRAEAGKLAWQLHQRREAAAQRLAREVEAELRDLRMAGARLQVALRVRPDPQGLPWPDGTTVAYGPTGADEAEFLLAPNPGEGFKPLARIASGGEMARIMLALKRVLAQADPVPTLIFDEIDQGIGGRIGAVVGEKLWRLARHHQVLCVTHLPQIAAFGDHHLKVAKVVAQGRTHTTVQPLTTHAARVAELAAMLGGDTETQRAAAEDLLRAAEAIKRPSQPT